MPQLGLLAKTGSLRVSCSKLVLIKRGNAIASAVGTNSIERGRKNLFSVVRFKQKDTTNTSEDDNLKEASLARMNRKSGRCVVRYRVFGRIPIRVRRLVGPQFRRFRAVLLRWSVFLFGFLYELLSEKRGENPRKSPRGENPRKSPRGPSANPLFRMFFRKIFRQVPPFWVQ